MLGQRGGTAGGMACKAVSLHPIVLHDVRGSAENFFADPREVGHLVSKDSQGDEEAV
jgi:hypothetical protein